MENEITTQTPVDSVIAAYGVSTSRRLSPFVLFLIGIVTFFLLILLFFWSFLGKITLPPQTVFLGVATPAQILSQLSPEQRNRLPTIWKTQIDTESHWPTLFGVSRGQEEWEFFVIAPRWSLARFTTAPQTIQKTRSIAQFPAPLLTTTTRTTTYLAWLAHTWRHPSAHAQFELYPDALTHISASTSEPFIGILYADTLRTNLSIPTETGATPTTTPDVYVRFDPRVTTTIREIFLQQVHIGHEDAGTLGFAPTSFQAQYNASGTVDLLSFETVPMTSSTKVRILGALGFSQRSVQTLPDGSALIERRLPNEEELQATTTYRTPFGELFLTDTVMRLTRGEPITASPLTSCASGPLVGRLSERALLELFKTLDLPFLSAPPGIQFHEQKGRMVVCKE